jgi:hypothetical protein
MSAPAVASQNKRHASCLSLQFVLLIAPYSKVSALLAGNTPYTIDIVQTELQQLNGGTIQVGSADQQSYSVTVDLHEEARNTITPTLQGQQPALPAVMITELDNKACTVNSTQRGWNWSIRVEVSLLITKHVVTRV